jgi:hypothetical protein
MKTLERVSDRNLAIVTALAQAELDRATARWEAAKHYTLARGTTWAEIGQRFDADHAKRWGRTPAQGGGAK